MQFRSVIEQYIGKKIILVSPSKGMPMPLKPVDLKKMEDDHFVAVGPGGVPYFVPLGGIRVLSVTGTGILQVYLK